jgi:adenylosuccinate synthase
MPITVVVGGQFGSEGKGKVAHFLAREKRVRYAVRVGGSNSGHTVIGSHGEPIIFRHLPTACLLAEVISVIPAGSYLNSSILLGEIEKARLTPEHLAIDPHAWVIEESDRYSEKADGLQRSIGSTESGTGAAVIRRASRGAAGTFAKDLHELGHYLRDTAELLHNGLERRERVLVEGTQGFGLSLLHSGSYPYCTSRDTTAASFVSEAGLSPIDVDEVVLVLRTFPIRVSGNSGLLANEVDWATVAAESGNAPTLVEHTSATNRIRRVARFDAEVVRRAIMYNKPTLVALNHLDYVDATCRVERRPTQRALEAVRKIEIEIGSPISLLGFGPDVLVWNGVEQRKAGANG